MNLHFNCVCLDRCPGNFSHCWVIVYIFRHLAHMGVALSFGWQMRMSWVLRIITGKATTPYFPSESLGKEQCSTCLCNLQDQTACERSSFLFQSHLKCSEGSQHKISEVNCSNSYLALLLPNFVIYHINHHVNQLLELHCTVFHRQDFQGSAAY